jgi:hypothetical protein
MMMISVYGWAIHRISIRKHLVCNQHLPGLETFRLRSSTQLYAMPQMVVKPSNLSLVGQWNSLFMRVCDSFGGIDDRSGDTIRFTAALQRR